jgi:hypothetical protein
MSTSAIVMMVIAMLILWGGMTLAIINVARFKGEEPEETFRDL